jgi:glycine/D-amino acid oxidase-like deaminating enzyme
MSASSAPAVIVVGAGIVGAACAEALAEGGCRVTVFEGGLAGAGATAASMGHVVVMDDSEAQLALSAYSRRRWTERAATLPAECEDRPFGTLWVAADEREMAGVREKAQRYSERGEAVEVLDAKALREAEPQLRPGLVGALRVTEDRVVYPPAATRHFLERARSLGATVREGAAVEDVSPRRVRVEGRWSEADLVVVAAGAASPRLVPALPIVPRRGHLVITDRYPGFLRHQVIELGYHTGYSSTPHPVPPPGGGGDGRRQGPRPSRGGGSGRDHVSRAWARESVAFNVQPRLTGQLLIGSSRELVGWDPAVNSSLRARMLRRAAEYVPGISALRALRTWVGFRPATPDGLPLIGEWEPGLMIAAGHEGLGVTTALGTARLVGDLALGRTPALDPSPFDPRRADVLHA